MAKFQKIGYLLLVVTLLSFSISGWAQNVKIKVEAPSQVVEGEQFRLNYIIESGDKIEEQIEVKEFVGFDVIYGPSTSTSVSTSVRNGKKETSYSKTFGYILQAKKKGKHTLPKVEISIDGKKHKSPNTVIEVTSTIKNEQKIEAFVRTIVSRPSINLNDTLSVTYRLYSTTDIYQIVDIQTPVMMDFYSNVIPFFQQIQKEEKIGKKKYNVIDIRKVILQPRSLGQKTIPQGEIKIEFGIPTGRKGKTLWGETYDEVTSQTQTLKLDSATVSVVNLTDL